MFLLGLGFVSAVRLISSFSAVKLFLAWSLIFYAVKLLSSFGAVKMFQACSLIWEILKYHSVRNLRGSDLVMEMESGQGKDLSMITALATLNF